MYNNWSAAVLRLAIEHKNPMKYTVQCHVFSYQINFQLIDNRHESIESIILFELSTQLRDVATIRLYIHGRNRTDPSKQSKTCKHLYLELHSKSQTLRKLIRLHWSRCQCIHCGTMQGQGRRGRFNVYTIFQCK